MIVTIDGPAGAGKSTVSKALAQRLGFQFLDTGAMYRAVTWLALQRDIPLEDGLAVQQIAAKLKIEFVGTKIFVHGVDATDAIREQEVNDNVGAVADNPRVRQVLVQLQRDIAARGRYVCEGRDQGTIAFPNAFCKIFLTASPEQRAQRRAAQLRLAGKVIDEERLLSQQNERDRQDRERIVGRLEMARDAIEVTTDDLGLDEVVDRLEELVSRKLQEATRS